VVTPAELPAAGSNKKEQTSDTSTNINENRFLADSEILEINGRKNDPRTGTKTAIRIKDSLDITKLPIVFIF